MPTTQRKRLILCTIAALLCALGAAAGLYHALTYHYDAAIRHFAVNAPGGITAAVLCIAAILIGAVAALFLRREKTATAAIPGTLTTFAAIVTAFMLLAVFMMSVRTFSQNDILPQLRVVLTALAAVYFFLVTSDKGHDSAVLPFVSMLPILYAILAMLCTYFNAEYGMNSPVKTWDLAMYVSMALFFTAEARCALRIPRPASYAFCGIACVVMCTANGIAHTLVALHDTVGHGFSLVEAAAWVCIALYALSRLLHFGKDTDPAEAPAEVTADA